MGFLMTGFAIGAFLGPITLAYSYDLTTSYGPAFLLFTALGLISALLCLPVRKPL